MIDNNKKTAVYITKGNRLYAKGKYRKALWYYLKAKRIDRENFAAGLNCANANFALKKYSKSIYYLNKLNLKYKDNAKIIHLLAQAHFELANYPQAERYYEKLIKLGAENPWNYNYLSQIYQKNKKYEKAFEAAWSALDLSDGKNVAHQLNFGYLLYEVNLEDNGFNILKWCNKWVKKYSDDPLVQYMGNALLGKQTSKNYTLKGIRQIFNAFASEFESTLGDLEYKTPEMIAQVLAENKVKKSKVLDIGCGTGLCGKYIKPFAKIYGLHGVDISIKMLVEAKKKKIYSKLICSDIIQYLSLHNDEYELVAGADVLTYFSGLENVFESVHNALKNKGFFVFSVSRLKGSGDFVLHPSGRYKHSAIYVEKLAKKCGFSITCKEECVIREEGGKPVEGLIYLLRKMA